MSQYTETQMRDQITLFVLTLSDYYNADYAKNYPMLTPPTFHAEYGRKFVRIVKKERGDRYGAVYCFIDFANGDLRKAAGWKAPAPHKRGNIFNENCDVGDDKPASLHGSGLYIR